MTKPSITTDLDRDPAWWSAWFEDDYSWDGLAKKDWQGWVVVDGRCVPIDQAPKGQDWPQASVQDYWRADPDNNWILRDMPAPGEALSDAELIKLDDTIWHRAHLPPATQDGERSWKADPADARFEAHWENLTTDLQTRLKHGFETQMDLFGVAVATEGRLQGAGLVLKSLPQPDQDEETPLHLSMPHACFLGDIRMENAQFGPGANFKYVSFGGDTDFESANFGGYAWFDSARFGGDAWFNSASFGGDARFGSASFGGYASFLSASFGGDASFESVSFGGDASFLITSFVGKAHFHCANFAGYASFHSASIGGYADFDSASIGGDASFESASFGRGARFESASIGGDASFESASIGGDASFHNASFGREASFESASFDGNAKFESVSFDGSASFQRASFGKSTGFQSASFGGYADFESASFGASADFRSASFGGYAKFESVSVGGYASFYSASFGGYASFDSASFDSAARFYSASFGRDASFNSACFRSDARFYRARFGGDARFNSASFGRDVGFESTRFGRDAGFDSASFGGDARFVSASFGRNAHFDSASFGGYARFVIASFGGDTHFDSASFGGYARFNSASFGGYAHFDSASFGGYARFNSASFGGDAWFESVSFGGDARFESAVFLTGALFQRGSQQAQMAGRLVQGASEADIRERLQVPPEDYDYVLALTHGAAKREMGAFKTLDLSDAYCLGPLDFSDRVFGQAPSFASRICAGMPKFYRAELHDGVNLKGASFRHDDPAGILSWDKLVARLKDRPGFVGETGKADVPPAQALKIAWTNQSLSKDQKEPELANPFWRAALIAWRDYALRLPSSDRPEDPTGLHWSDVSAKDWRVAMAEDAPAFEQGYRRLKLLMGGMGAHIEEQRFFACELRARQTRDPETDNDIKTWEVLAARAYGALADYGRSAVRPVCWLGALWAGFFLLYSVLAVGSCALPETGCPVRHQIAEGVDRANPPTELMEEYAVLPQLRRDLFALTWAGGQVLSEGVMNGPFLFAAELTIAPVANPIRHHEWAQSLVERGDGWSTLFGFARWLHRILALPLIFLFALALRRRFQLG